MYPGKSTRRFSRLLVASLRLARGTWKVLSPAIATYLFVWVLHYVVLLAIYLKLLPQRDAIKIWNTAGVIGLSVFPFLAASIYHFVQKIRFRAKELPQDHQERVGYVFLVTATFSLLMAKALDSSFPSPVFPLILAN